MKGDAYDSTTENLSVSCHYRRGILDLQVENSLHHLRLARLPSSIAEPDEKTADWTANCVAAMDHADCYWLMVGSIDFYAAANSDGLVDE